MRRRAIIVGAGRIGAGFNWEDKAYTHAGAYMALKDRVELVGIVETDQIRLQAARAQWSVPCMPNLDLMLHGQRPDIVSVCVQPWEQQAILKVLFASAIRGIWCEKPYWGPPNPPIPVQVNYMRRAAKLHQEVAVSRPHTLNVVGKLDYHTLPHFEDLARWWKVRQLNYTIYDGPCHYEVHSKKDRWTFPNGGVVGAACFELMLQNILDHLDNGTSLLSPA